MVVVAALLGVVAASCGTTADNQFRAVSPDKVPFDLAEASTTTTSTTTTVATTTTTTPTVTTTVPATEAVRLFFVDKDNHLRPVVRNVVKPKETDKLPPSRILAELLAGPKAPEVGLRSALGVGMVSAPTDDAGTAVVAVAPTFVALDNTEKALASAQLVYTLTEPFGVGQVRFTYNGDDVPSLLADGTPVDRVSRGDYEPIFLAG